MGQDRPSTGFLQPSPASSQLPLPPNTTIRIGICPWISYRLTQSLRNPIMQTVIESTTIGAKTSTQETLGNISQLSCNNRFVPGSCFKPDLSVEPCYIMHNCHHLDRRGRVLEKCPRAFRLVGALFLYFQCVHLRLPKEQFEKVVNV